MFKARHEMIALAALLVVAVVALVVFEVAHLGHLHFWGKRTAHGYEPTREVCDGYIRKEPVARATGYSQMGSRTGLRFGPMLITV